MPQFVFTYCLRVIDLVATVHPLKLAIITLNTAGGCKAGVQLTGQGRGLWLDLPSIGAIFKVSQWKELKLLGHTASSSAFASGSLSWSSEVRWDVRESHRPLQTFCIDEENYPRDFGEVIAPQAAS